LHNPALLNLIHQAGSLAGVPAERLELLMRQEPHPGCECPHCSATTPQISKTQTVTLPVNTEA
ncbi:MAG: hypothetical protein ACWGO1_03820, partial [Anaerolineales bacterium]